MSGMYPKEVSLKCINLFQDCESKKALLPGLHGEGTIEKGIAGTNDVIWEKEKKAV